MKTQIIQQEKKVNLNKISLFIGIPVILILLGFIIYLLMFNKNSYESGMKFLSQNNYSLALAEFEKIPPDNENYNSAASKIFFIKGMGLYSKGELKQAKEFFDKMNMSDDKYSEGQLLVDKINSEIKLKEALLKINEGEVEAFVNRWANLQTNKEMYEYLKMYSDDFQGIKNSGGNRKYYDKSGWGEDRTKMYRNANNLFISVYNITVKNLNDPLGSAVAKFSQSYYSDTYSDTGEKILKLRKNDNGNLQIYYEEMLSSQRIDMGEEGC